MTPAFPWDLPAELCASAARMKGSQADSDFAQSMADSVASGAELSATYSTCGRFCVGKMGEVLGTTMGEL